MWFVYFLKPENKVLYYVGSTDNLERRLKEHNSGKVRSSKAYIPLKMVHVIEFPSEALARENERKIKKQRLLKEQIIRTITE